MAVAAMKKVRIYALKRDRKAILEKLQAMGVLEVQMDGSETEGFKKMNTAYQRSHYDKRVQNTEEALEILGRAVPEKTSMFASLEGKKEISEEAFNDIITNRHKYNVMVNDIIQCDKNISSRDADIAKIETSIEGLRPWINMDIPINTTETGRTKIFTGSMAPGLDAEQITSLVKARNPKLDEFFVQVISQDKDQTCISAVCIDKDAAAFEEAIRAEGFSRISFMSHRTPEGKIKKYQNDIHTIREQQEQEKKKLESFAENREKLKILADYYSVRRDKYYTLGGLLQSESTFIITGYVQADDEAALRKALEDRYTLLMETEDIPEDEEAPVQLKNRKFFQCGEGVLSSFGLPHKGEMDPTAPMTICYIFLFGIMLSDAAYGALVFLACLVLLKKFPKMGDAMRKSLSLFTWCGLSTLFWGILFGGYFGDVVNVVSRVFFHHEVTIPPVWFAPIDDPMKMLIVSLVIGLAHLYFGLGLKGYMQLKAKDITGFISDVLSWYMLVTGLIMMFMPTSLFASIAQFEVHFSPAVKNVSYVLALAGAVIIFLMSGRDHKNPVLRLALGLYDLYNITGWISDLLSYSRLLALGLATGVIAQVINQMGSMVGDNVFGVIVFIIVFIIGHLFNMAINLLGAYVHTCRLQYVEFFGKFYDGGGRQFMPFHAETRYNDVVEAPSGEAPLRKTN